MLRSYSIGETGAPRKTDRSWRLPPDMHYPRGAAEERLLERASTIVEDPVSERADTDFITYEDDFQACLTPTRQRLPVSRVVHALP